MKLMISGFEQPAEINEGYALSLEVEDRRLFTRICQSLHSELGEAALEPYVVFDDEGAKVRPAKRFYSCSIPLICPGTKGHSWEKLSSA